VTLILIKFHVLAAASVSDLRGGCPDGWVSSTRDAVFSATYCYKVHFWKRLASFPKNTCLPTKPQILSLQYLYFLLEEINVSFYTIVNASGANFSLGPTSYAILSLVQGEKTAFKTTVLVFLKYGKVM